MSGKDWSEHLLFKVRQLLRIFVFVLLIIGLRITYLTTIKHEEFSLKAKLHPKRKQVIPASRGSIVDRFGAPLAVNQIQYQVALCYKDLYSVPRVRFVSHVEGKKKTYPRRDKIHGMCEFLSKELNMPFQKIEDLVYGKAALTPDVRVTLFDGVDEKTYCRIKARQHHWPGLQVEAVQKRHYPEGKLAAHVLGYLGPINEKEYQKVLLRLDSLRAQAAVEDEAFQKEIFLDELHKLERSLYRNQDLVGKMGVEKSYEGYLRGHSGKKTYQVNSKGMNIIRDQVEEEAIPGHLLKLSISAELQKYAENLLCTHDKIRDHPITKVTVPWMKGGSIVAMDPHTGEVVALASYPTFNPNDFIDVRDETPFKDHLSEQVSKWLENEDYFSNLWDGFLEWEREVYDLKSEHLDKEVKPLDWDETVSRIVGPESKITVAQIRAPTVGHLVRLQNAFRSIQSYLGDEFEGWTLINYLYDRPVDKAYWPRGIKQSFRPIDNRYQEVSQAVAIEPLKQICDEYLGELESNFDKLIFLDLSRLLIDSSAVSPELHSYFYTIDANYYREVTQSYLRLNRYIHKKLKSYYKSRHFQDWREEHQKAFLKEKRKIEKKNKQWARSYLYYLNKEFEDQFSAYWEKNNSKIITSLVTHEAIDETLAPVMNYLREGLKEEANEKLVKDYQLLHSESLVVPIDEFESYLATFRSFKSLNDPLLAYYPLIHFNRSYLQTQKDLARRAYPRYGVGYLTHWAFASVTPPGSIFKIVVAHEALCQKYFSGQSTEINPLTITDAYSKKSGEIAYVGNWESGNPIPQIYKGGRIPRSHRKYLGKIDLLAALENSSNTYFSLLADEFLEDSEQDLLRAAQRFNFGHKTMIDLPYEAKGMLPDDLGSNKTGLYTSAIGQHTLLSTPLQAAAMLSTVANGGHVVTPKVVMYHQDQGGRRFERGLEIQRTVPMPEEVQHYLFEGMRRVVSGSQGCAMTVSPRLCSPGSYERKVFNRMIPYMIGKTSTAEVVEIEGISPPSKLNKTCHNWFGGIFFDKPILRSLDLRNMGETKRGIFKNRTPELVVVVYLRYGDYGKEAAPLAALVANKWRKIQAEKAKGLEK